MATADIYPTTFLAPGPIPAFALMSAATTGSGPTTTVPASWSNSLPPGSADQLAALTRRYVDAFIATPKPPKPARSMFVTDPNRRRISNLCAGNLALFGQMTVAARSPANMGTITSAAAAHSDTFDAGLCVGFMNSEYTCDSGNADFREGFRKGQAYRLCSASTPEQAAFHVSAAITAASVYSLAITPMQFDPRHLEILGRLAEPAMILLGGSLVYGLYAAVDARQIGNSNTLPDKLKTDGVHRYHRNPYVAGTDLAAMLASGAAIFTNMMSTNPRPFLAAALAAATSAFVWFRHRAVVREERTLERLFDVRYRTYLNSTTRYVPDVVKMIEDFRNWLLGKNA